VSERIPGTVAAERLLTGPNGATMDEIRAATGGPQFNVLKKLEARGYKIRKVKEGKATRYFVEPPAVRVFETVVTSNGQVTIPKEIRDRMGIRVGSKIRFSSEDGNRVVMTPASLSIRDLFGILPKPKRAMRLEEMDEAVRKAAVERNR
jgi:AbrB family looped-hinge helix DNA binding protein